MESFIKMESEIQILCQQYILSIIYPIIKQDELLGRRSSTDMTVEVVLTLQFQIASMEKETGCLAVFIQLIHANMLCLRLEGLANACLMHLGGLPARPPGR